jgi:hypothetical protein
MASGFSSLLLRLLKKTISCCMWLSHGAKTSDSRLCAFPAGRAECGGVIGINGPGRHAGRGLLYYELAFLPRLHATTTASLCLDRGRRTSGRSFHQLFRLGLETPSITWVPIICFIIGTDEYVQGIEAAKNLLDGLQELVELGKLKDWARRER